MLKWTLGEGPVVSGIGLAISSWPLANLLLTIYYSNQVFLNNTQARRRC